MTSSFASLLRPTLAQTALPAPSSDATPTPVRRVSMLGALLATTLIVSGCAYDRIDHLGKAPTMSPLGDSRTPIDPAAVPPAAALKRPEPVVLAPNDLRGGQRASLFATGTNNRHADVLWKTGPTSLFTDRRARQVGDIVTILIEIDDEAEISNTTTRSRTGSDEIGVTAGLGLPEIADVILPGANTLDPAVSTNSSSTSEGDGAVSRNEEIDLRIAATVVDVLPNGNLVVTGYQEVRVNFELRDLQVAGVIRPEDISRSNTITYDKIAEARISYGGRGQISDLQQPRYGQQVLDILSPF